MRELDIALWKYDRGQALIDGSVEIEGVDARFHSGRIATEIFEAMIRRRAYDVAELGMTYYLRTFDEDAQPFLALPVFPGALLSARCDLHQQACGHCASRDLNGKTLGELASWLSMATTRA